MRQLRRPWIVVSALASVITAVLGFVWYRAALADGGPSSASASASEAPTTAQPPQTPRRTSRPNVLFILTDDLSSNLLPFMPHVKELQQRGMTFSNFFDTNSLCCPSRSSILTGGYPHTTGVLTNGGGDGGNAEFVYRKDDEHTFATSLQAVGYTTAMMGKYLNGYRVITPEGSPTPVPPGWDEWYVPGDHDGYSGYDYTLNENGRLVWYGHEPTDYFTDMLSAKGADFIHRAATSGKPFLLEVSTFSPHAPYTPAPRHLDAFPGLTYPRTPAFDAARSANAPQWLAARPPLSAAAKNGFDTVFRKRAQAVLSIDDLVAHLMATLEAEGLAENTYIVFSSDNGYHMGEHRLPIGKMTAFDTDVRVPLVVSGPGIQAGASSDAVVSNIDLCPTFETFGHSARTSLVDGRSLGPLLRGESPTDWRSAILIEHRHPETRAQAGPDTESLAANLPSYHAMRFRDALYVEYVTGEREYYDLTDDPYQLRNLAPQLTPAQRAMLHRSLSAMVSCRGTEMCRAAEKAAVHPSSL